jgi:homocitrate synthase NifV
VRNAYARLGMVLSGEQAGALLERIRGHVTATKRAPTDAELIGFHVQAQPCPMAPAGA